MGVAAELKAIADAEAAYWAQPDWIVTKSAVTNGKATSEATNMDHCWQGEESVHCPERKMVPEGETMGVGFPIKIAHRDFRIELVFSMLFRHSTGAGLSFMSGKHEQHIMVDAGPDCRVAVGGGSFGKEGPENTFGEAPTEGERHTLVATRFDKGEGFSITVDGVTVPCEETMPGSISSVTVRPWKNKMEVFEF